MLRKSLKRHYKRLHGDQGGIELYEEPSSESIDAKEMEPETMVNASTTE